MKKTKNEMPQKKDVVNILMKRDNISEEDALAMLAACRSELNNALSRGVEWEVCEDIIQNCLGLEMDYILEIVA